MLNLPPLHIFIQTEVLSTLSRVTKNQNLFRETDHTKIWLEHIKKAPNLIMPSDKITKVYKFDKKFDIHIPPREDWLNRILPPDNEIVYYSFRWFTNKRLCRCRYIQ